MTDSDTPRLPKLLPDEIHQAVKPGTALLRLETTDAREGILDGVRHVRYGRYPDGGLTHATHVRSIF
ncbi:hypothetical protein [Streptomyces gobiensis]|uniref:hypothetical protein n=1 Tax=Streptomyces gobiensis TaxID=2875706 RepID=UPI001E402E7C|nr:hypothetical protein [Streptomyces gobiensis]UGY95331.1 hypothetical protein test1122_21775 [Streptomyces gobiensis]